MIKSKRFVLFSFSTILVILSLTFIAACAAPVPSPAPSPTATPTPEKTWNLKLHHHTTGITHETAFVPYVKMIEDATKGRVKVTIYPSATLGKMEEAYTLATSGIADIAWGLSSAFPGQFPVTDMLSLPILGIPNAVVGGRIMWALYQKFPDAYAKEFSEVKVLAMHAGSPNLVCTAKKPVRTITDLKGLTMRTPPGPPTEVMKLLGANPVMMSPQDTYLGMEKGTIDGHLFDWIALETFKLSEVTKYYTLVPYSMPTFWIVMNKGVWNSMPSDVQQALMNVNGEAAAKHFGGVWDSISEKAKGPIASKAGNEVIPVSPDELAKWYAIAKTVHDSYITKLVDKGLPAKEILAELLRLKTEYSK